MAEGLKILKLMNLNSDILKNIETITVFYSLNANWFIDNFFSSNLYVDTSLLAVLHLNFTETFSKKNEKKRNI